MAKSHGKDRRPGPQPQREEAAARLVEGANHPDFKTEAELQALREEAAPAELVREVEAGLERAGLIEVVAPTAEEQTSARPPRGLYFVRADGLPRRLIDTGLDAGAYAEAVARDRYYHALDLQPRPSIELIVELCQ